MNPTDNKVFDEVYQLQKELTQVGTLVGRFDTTIEKLTEVSSQVSQLLAVHSHRLDSQDKMSNNLQNQFETRKIHTDVQFKEVNQKIDLVENDLSHKIDEHHDKVLDEIKILSNDIKKSMQDSNNLYSEKVKELDNKLSRVEKVMFIASGVVGVIGYLLSQGLSLISSGNVHLPF